PTSDSTVSPSRVRSDATHYYQPRSTLPIKRDPRPFAPQPENKMSGSAAKWKEEQILVICPGSRTTMAQLGCSELTPPVHRIPTRMFKDPEDGGWRPYHTFKRKKPGFVKKVSEGAQQNGEAKAAEEDEDEWEWVEDQDSDEGAVYPMQAGRIVNMPAFLAFLDHIHSMLTTTYHNTPIVLMASPQWTRDCIEEITRYIFEKTKTPSLCLIHSAVATQYGLRWPHMTVVDIGFEKVDVTCIYEGSVVNHMDLGVSYGKVDGIRSGGEVFTQRLLDLLKDKGFNYDMAEKLKKSGICEVLAYNPDVPGYMELPKENLDPAGGAALGAGNDPIKVAAEASRPPIVLDEEDVSGESKGVDEDGVLDVATIVTSGQTKEFLAKKEKEKGKTGKRGKGQDEGQNARNIRLPNSKRMCNVFHYEEVIHEEVPKPKPAPPAPAAAPAPAAPPTTVIENGVEKPASTDEASKKEAEDAMKVDAPDAPNGPASTSTEPNAASASDAPKPVEDEGPVETELQAKLVRRDIEVGLERFLFADREQIDRITTLIWKTIQSIPDMFMRPACWDHIVIVGNGSRIRGLRDNIIQTLTARHLISPSSATIFTPTGSFTGTPHQLPTTGGVNPLLQAATTATLNAGQAAAVVGAPGSEAGGAAAGTSHRFHSQTPTSIKLAPLPTYLSEWSKNGYEEAMFLGSQVAGRIAFCLHNLDGPNTEAQKRMSLSRVEYNELGPKGIRKHSMLS
ncbi:hypothetical protein jhhlp_003527, partial [Lomentospora prolificans]